MKIKITYMLVGLAETTATVTVTMTSIHTAAITDEFLILVNCWFSGLPRTPILLLDIGESRFPSIPDYLTWNNNQKIESRVIIYYSLFPQLDF